MFEAHPHAPLFLAFLAIVFIAIISYMLLYGKRSKDHQKSIESHGHPMASKEEGILEAQEAMKQERRQHHRHE